MKVLLDECTPKAMKVALAMTRETGSSMASSMPTTAETWLGARRSISSWACCFSCVESCATKILSALASTVQHLPLHAFAEFLFLKGINNSKCKSHTKILLT